MQHIDWQMILIAVMTKHGIVDTTLRADDFEEAGLRFDGGGVLAVEGNDSLHVRLVNAAEMDAALQVQMSAKSAAVSLETTSHPTRGPMAFPPSPRRTES